MHGGLETLASPSSPSSQTQTGGRRNRHEHRRVGALPGKEAERVAAAEAPSGTVAARNGRAEAFNGVVDATHSARISCFVNKHNNPVIEGTPPPARR